MEAFDARSPTVTVLDVIYNARAQANGNGIRELAISRATQERNAWNQVLILLRIFKSSENHCVILHRESDVYDSL